jgi:CMP-N-acetylneuraminic acid synthetase
VSPVPTKYHRDVQRCIKKDGYLYSFDLAPFTRQGLDSQYVRNGHVYIYNPWVIEHDQLYGGESMPLIIDGPTISIDTPDDWAEAERILIEREGDRRHE